GGGGGGGGGESSPPSPPPPIFFLSFPYPLPFSIPRRSHHLAASTTGRMLRLRSAASSQSCHPRGVVWNNRPRGGHSITATIISKDSSTERLRKRLGKRPVVNREW